MSFVEFYPEDHEQAGKPVERETECSRCGNKFVQVRISRDWLNSMNGHSPKAMESFLQACQVEVVEAKRQVYIPARCGDCTHRSMLDVRL